MEKSTDNSRKRELAQIHIAKAKLGMDDETYRAMLWTIARVRSAGDLDWAGRKRVLDHLKSRGFTIQSKRRPTPAKDKQHLVAKIRALLMNAQPVRDDAYADALSARMFGVDRYTWCDVAQLTKIVAALSIDARRRAKL